MKNYLALMEDVLENGIEKEDRTKTGTYSVFGRQLRFNLQDGFPAVTTKKLFLKGVIIELLWFLSGDTNIKYLVDNGVGIWNDWPYKHFRESDDYNGETMKEFIELIKQSDADSEFVKIYGELGPVYGKQWRNFVGANGSIDQIKNIMDQVKNNPDSRRIMVNAWNGSDVELGDDAYVDSSSKGKMALPPCHYGFQLYVGEGKVSLMWSQRSVDIFLGLPFNVASYAVLLHMIAQQAGLEVGELIMSGGDVHLYQNHVEQAQLQLEREPMASPTLVIKRKPESIFDYRLEDFELVGYDHHPAIKAPVAV